MQACQKWKNYGVLALEKENNINWLGNGTNNIAQLLEHNI